MNYKDLSHAKVAAKIYTVEEVCSFTDTSMNSIRFWYMLTYLYKDRNNEDLDVSVSREELYNYLGLLNNSRKRATLVALLKDVSSKGFSVLSEENGKLTYKIAPYVTSITEVEFGGDRYVISLNPKVVDYIICNQYALVQFKVLEKLKNSTELILYPFLLLKSFKSNEFKISIEKLKVILDCTSASYKESRGNYLFLKKVLGIRKSDTSDWYENTIDYKNGSGALYNISLVTNISVKAKPVKGDRGRIEYVLFKVEDKGYYSQPIDSNAGADVDMIGRRDIYNNNEALITVKLKEVLPSGNIAYQQPKQVFDSTSYEVPITIGEYTIPVKNMIKFDDVVKLCNLYELDFEVFTTALLDSGYSKLKNVGVFNHKPNK